MRRFSSTVSGAEHGAAADELDDADPGPQLGIRVGDGPAVEAARRRGRRRPSPLMTRSSVDLPAPLVPSRASTSPSRTSRSMSNSTCTGP